MQDDLFDLSSMRGKGLEVKPAPERSLPAATQDRAPLPAPSTLSKLREAARECRACPLWKLGTQPVFGVGPVRSRVMLVGEQPGFDEDVEGKPFVGPAGKLLDKALAQAGLPREDVYLTNVVKHFKWEPKGQLHIHKKANAKEIAACRPWLEAELELLKPDVLVCLGATAAQALLGKDFRVTRQRGQWIESPWAKHVLATVHPSSILRAPDEDARHAQMNRFVEDLKIVSGVIRHLTQT